MPDGKVEGVDVNGNTLKRAQNVLRHEGTVARQRLDGTFGQNTRVRQFSARLGGEGQKRTDAALDVGPAVLAARPGGEILKVEFFLEIHELQADVLQHQRALVDGHGAQRRAALFAAPLQRRLEVQPLGADQGVDVAGRGIQHRPAFALAPTPGALEIAFQTARCRPRCHDGPVLLS